MAVRGLVVLLGAATCLSVVPAAADPPGRGPAPDGARTSATSALRQSIAELVAMPGGPPGAVVVVQTGASRTSYTGGVAALHGRRPRITDHMRVASVAKAFSGATALVLVNKGVLRLRDTVGHWLPYLPASWHRVTLRELLDHTSGIPDFSQGKGFLPAVLAAPTRPPRPRKLLTYAGASSTSRPAPSTRTRTRTTSPSA